VKKLFLTLPALAVLVSLVGRANGQELALPAVVTRIETALPGTVIQLDAGDIAIGRTVNVPSGVTIKGAPNGAVVFTLPRGAYAFQINGDAADVTIDGVAIVGGGIALSRGSIYRNIRITNCSISRTAATPGVYCSIPSVGLAVENTVFQDFADYGAVIYHWDKGSFSGNRFSNIIQGCHILNPNSDCVIRGNVGRKLQRMGIEVQQLDASAPRTTNLLVEGNVITDWVLPYADSFGLSIMPERSDNTVIRGNYVLARYSGPRGPVNENGNLFGFGIEAGFTTGSITENVVAGPFWYGIVVSQPNMSVSFNKLYGIERGHEVTGEVNGRPVPRSNSFFPNLDNLPPMPDAASGWVTPAGTSRRH
jgi:hypothetical protein